MAKYSTPEQIETLLKGPSDTPVVMLKDRSAGLEHQWLIACTASETI